MGISTSRLVRPHGFARAKRAISMIFPKQLSKIETDPSVGTRLMRKALAMEVKHAHKTGGRKGARRFYLKAGAYHHRFLKNTVKHFPGKVGNTKYAPTKV